MFEDVEFLFLLLLLLEFMNGLVFLECCGFEGVEGLGFGFDGGWVLIRGKILGLMLFDLFWLILCFLIGDLILLKWMMLLVV